MLRTEWYHYFLNIKSQGMMIREESSKFFFFLHIFDLHWRSRVPYLLDRWRASNLCRPSLELDGNSHSILKTLPCFEFRKDCKLFFRCNTWFGPTLYVMIDRGFYASNSGQSLCALNLPRLFKIALGIQSRLHKPKWWAVLFLTNYRDKLEKHRHAYRVLYPITRLKMKSHMSF